MIESIIQKNVYAIGVDILHTSKKTIYFIMLIPLCLILLTLCLFSSPSASEVALSYYSLFIKQDASPVISSKIMDKETAHLVLDNVKEHFRNQIINDLSIEGRITLSSDQLNQIETAYFELLSQLECSATSTKNGNRYIVTLHSTCIDFDAISDQATQYALSEINISHYGQHADYLSDLVNAYTSYLVKSYENTKPLQVTQEAQFTFTKQHGLWLPENYEAFTNVLTDLIYFSS